MMRPMRILLSTIGSRGDVQPIVALASQLKTLGQDVRLCVPPDFTEWIAGLGLPVIPIGPPVRAFAAARPQGPTTPASLESARAMVDESIATQFTTLTAAAQDCDAIVAATALQVAARSVAEALGIRYVYAGYSTFALQPRASERFDTLFAPGVNAHRAAMGLAPVDDMRRHMFTERPWLAADATLGPWPDSADAPVFQTGAWLLPDDRPLPPEVEAFLDAGEPPVYFGFGSSQAPEDLGRAALEAARRLGRRAIVSRGWWTTRGIAWRLARATCARSSAASPPSSITAARAPHTWPRSAARRRSSSRRSMTRRIGRNECRIWASASPTRAARQPPTC